MRIRSVLLTTFACLLLTTASVDAAQVKLAWDPNPEPDVTGYIVEYGPISAPFTQAVDVGKVTTWTLATAVEGVTYGFRVVAYDADGLRSDASKPVYATSDGPVTSSLTPDRLWLNFGVLAGAPHARTSSQSIRLTQNGTGAVSWSVTSSAPWLQVSPASGTGTGSVTVSLVPGALPAAGAVATLTVNANGIFNTISPIPVSINVIAPSSSTAPVGTVDSPADNITGVTGSVAITGWAVDDIDVTHVRIFRDSVPGEAPGQLVYVGEATMVEDARPDVNALYPGNPQSVRAGWGYLMLSNMLPGLGNSTFRFSVYAYDAEGHSTLLGTRTITCTNSTAVQPFGAIDTPTPGETVAGSYTSFGWVLARAPRRADVPGGGSVSVLIDGVAVGSPSGWSARPDLLPLFPAAEYPGINSAVANYSFDTRALANGMHTMAWVVTDNRGNAAGVGSRYFRVFNSTASAMTLAPAATSLSALTLGAELEGATRERSSVMARRGYATDTPLRRYHADHDGRVTLQAEELDRIELQTNGATAGYMLSGTALRPLPIGSRLDPATGHFVWQPGVAFIGSYDLAFLRHAGGRIIRQDVRIVLNPKGSNRVGPQLVIDLAPGPREDATDGIVAGWAADLDSPDGTGVSMIHAWAYPRGGGAPMFVADAAYGGSRPDVAEVFGERFRDSGYGLRVQGLPPGTYDLALFAWSTARHAWLPAKLVTISVK